MALMRAQLVHKHRSGLPRDHFVNTFHFVTPGTTAADAEACAEQVRDMFTIQGGTMSEPLNRVLSDAIALTGHEVRVYPVDSSTGEDPRGPGQAPLHIEVFDHIGRADTAGPNLPSEVALCLSYKNTQSGSTPPARKRGRIYLGPFLSSGMLTDVGTDQTSRPSAYLRDLVMAAGQYMVSLNDAFSEWVIYSRPFAGRTAISAEDRANAGGPFRSLPAIPARAGMTHAITDLWVDNAWDTVRRRGERASTRATAVV